MTRQSKGKPETQGRHGEHQQQKGAKHQQQTCSTWPAVPQPGCRDHDRQALQQADDRDVENRRQHDRTPAAQRCHQQSVQKAELTVEHHRQPGIQSTAECGENDDARSEKTAVTHPTGQQSLRRIGEQGSEQSQPDQWLKNSGHKRGRPPGQLQEQSPGQREGFLGELRQGTLATVRADGGCEGRRGHRFSLNPISAWTGVVPA
ncbi:MAG: Uncharacterised protein [Synechococcus sp. CC9902]|nr:MAG: Uncharacterised protein [Synechococcus sp. CC9902]